MKTRCLNAALRTTQKIYALCDVQMRKKLNLGGFAHIFQLSLSAPKKADSLSLRCRKESHDPLVSPMQ